MSDKEELALIKIQLQITRDKLDQVIEINKEIRLATGNAEIAKDLAKEITATLEEKAADIADALASKVADKVVIEIKKP